MIMIISDLRFTLLHEVTYYPPLTTPPLQNSLFWPYFEHNKIRPKKAILALFFGIWSLTICAHNHRLGRAYFWLI